MPDKNTTFDKLQKRIEKLEARLKFVQNTITQLDRINNQKAVLVTGSLETPKKNPINISKYQLIEIYHDIPQLLSEYTFQVSVTSESYRQKTQGLIFLETVNRGNYWIIGTNYDSKEQYWLLPAANLTINIHKLKTFQYLFNLVGESPSETTEFMLNEPAQVSRFPSGNIWKLEKQGIIEFGKNNRSSQLLFELEKANKKNQELYSQFKLLTQEFAQITHQLEQLGQDYKQEKYSQISELENIKKQLKQEQQEHKQLQLLITQADQERRQMRNQIEQMSDLLFQIRDELETKPAKEEGEVETKQAQEENATPTSPNWQNVQLLHILKGHTHIIRSLTVWHWQQGSKKQIIASGSYDKTIKIWNLQTGELINSLTGASIINILTISPDGYTLVSNGDNNTINVWNLNTASHKVFSGHSNLVLSLAISPDGKILFSGSRDHTLKLWDINTGEIIDTVTEDCGNTITAFDISLDGKILVSSSSDCTIRVWDFNPDQQARVSFNRVLLRHSDLIWSVAINPDEQVIVGGSRDGTIRLWDINTGELINTLEGHSDAVWSIDINPVDGQVIASGSADRSIKLWNLKTGELLCTLSENSQEIYAVAFSPDGKFLVSGGKDQTIKVWQVSSG